ncbi:glycerophosphoryl diester phosphodiesterase membrane domain-containing protein [Streptomyces pathocidini]|uniref:glycerophosphoryl diester phosphodiesterase membrane domain-containing protein n=1 Tax=Streptomyces pathocidini TaxID=1650571 RepID=UPI0033D6E0F1
MNDSPGWASPGSSPSDDQGRNTPAPAPPPPDPGNTPGWGPQGGQSGWYGPAGGYGGPGGGWGGQNGWHAGWAQTPAAAKPGVIPLRPIALGEILDGAIATIRVHWRTVLPISIGIAAISEAINVVATGLWFTDTESIKTLENHTSPTFSEVLDVARDGMVGGAVTGLIGLLAAFLATSLLTTVISKAILGRPTSITETWRATAPRLPQLLALFFLLFLLIAAVLAVGVGPGAILAGTGNREGGAALIALGTFVALVAIVWLWTRFSLAIPALVLEKQSALASLRRSAKLVRGSWWRIFGIQLLTSLLAFLLAAAIAVPATVINFGLGDRLWPSLIVTGIASVIASTATLPLNANVIALLYTDQRIRRESLDLELARAAGISL